MIRLFTLAAAAAATALLAPALAETGRRLAALLGGG